MSRYIVKKAYNINVQQGDSCTILFNVPVDISLSGKEVVLTVENICKGPNPNLVFSTTNGKISVNVQAITVVVLPIDTESKVGSYVWYLQVIGSSTDKLTIGKGKFNVIDKRVV